MKKLIFTLLCAAATMCAAPLSTFTFSGVCSDCQGNGTATLVLQNYTIGNPVLAANLVSFTYNGTNLMNAYVLTPANVDSLFGKFEPTLPSNSNFYISGMLNSALNVYFETIIENNSWSTGTETIVNDFGGSPVWTAVPNASTGVPEPASFLLIAPAGLALWIAKRRNS